MNRDTSMFKPAQALVMEAKKTIRESPIDDIEKALTVPNTLIIDVREPEEYTLGHLPNAVNFPRGLLEFKLSADPVLQDTNRAIVVYCKTSGRAALAAATLQSMGFGNVVSVAGGYDAWAQAGKPVTRPGGAN